MGKQRDIQAAEGQIEAEEPVVEKQPGQFEMKRRRGIGYSPKKKMEVLRVVEDPQIALELTDSTKPGLIRAGKDFLYVLMPVTV